MRRCKVTGNPCGTDTWEVNSPCRCHECQLYLVERATEKSEPAIVTLGWSQLPHIQIGGPQLPHIIFK